MEKLSSGVRTGLAGHSPRLLTIGWFLTRFNSWQEIRGPTTFTKLLGKWSENIEAENANRGSPFGQVKRTIVEKEVETMPDLSGTTGAAYERDDNGRLVIQVTEK